MSQSPAARHRHDDKDEEDLAIHCTGATQVPVQAHSAKESAYAELGAPIGLSRWHFGQLLKRGKEIDHWRLSMEQYAAVLLNSPEEQYWAIQRPANTLPLPEVPGDPSVDRSAEQVGAADDVSLDCMETMMAAVESWLETQGFVVEDARALARPSTMTVCLTDGPVCPETLRRCQTYLLAAIRAAQDRPVVDTVHYSMAQRVVRTDGATQYVYCSLHYEYARHVSVYLVSNRASGSRPVLAEQLADTWRQAQETLGLEAAVVLEQTGVQDPAAAALDTSALDVLGAYAADITAETRGYRYTHGVAWEIGEPTTLPGSSWLCRRRTPEEYAELRRRAAALTAK